MNVFLTVATEECWSPGSTAIEGPSFYCEGWAACVVSGAGLWDPAPWVQFLKNISIPNSMPQWSAHPTCCLPAPIASSPPPHTPFTPATHTPQLQTSDIASPGELLGSILKSTGSCCSGNYWRRWTWEKFQTKPSILLSSPHFLSSSPHLQADHKWGLEAISHILDHRTHWPQVRTSLFCSFNLLLKRCIKSHLSKSKKEVKLKRPVMGQNSIK